MQYSTIAMAGGGGGGGMGCEQGGEGKGGLGGMLIPLILMLRGLLFSSDPAPAEAAERSQEAGLGTSERGPGSDHGRDSRSDQQCEGDYDYREGGR